MATTRLIEVECLDDVIEQRDELLAALQAVVRWWEGTPSASPETSHGEYALSVYEQSHAAIAKIKEGA